jgi:hypothetical protein
MRFSAAFTLPLPLPRAAQPAEPGRAEAAGGPEAPRMTVATDAQSARPDLPEDLDARVRLIGEWQLGEPD